MPPPTLSGEQAKRSDAESGKTDAGADDVDDGIDGADLVEMNFFEGDVVYGGFGFAEFAEDGGGAGFYVCVKRRFFDDGENCGEGAVRLRVFGSDDGVGGGHAVFPNFFGGELPAGSWSEASSSRRRSMGRPASRRAPRVMSPEMPLKQSK